MRSALAALLAVTFAAACSSPTAPDITEPTPAAATAATVAASETTPAPAPGPPPETPSFSATFGERGTVDIANHTEYAARVRVDWAASDGAGGWRVWESSTLLVPAGGTVRYSPNCWYRGLNQVGVPWHGLWNQVVETGSSSCSDPGVVTN